MSLGYSSALPFSRHQASGWLFLCMSFCMTVIVTKCMLVTFHSERVRTVRQVMGPHLKSLTRDQLFFGELQSVTLTRKASSLAQNSTYLI
jgi:hypothetical protein